MVISYDFSWWSFMGRIMVISEIESTGFSVFQMIWTMARWTGRQSVGRVAPIAMVGIYNYVYIYIYNFIIIYIYIFGLSIDVIISMSEWLKWLKPIVTYHVFWLVVYLPLRKIWVRQLGWWHSQLNGKITSFSKPPTTYSTSNWNFQVQPACRAPSSNIWGTPRTPNRDAMRCAVRKIHLSICLIWAYWTNRPISRSSPPDARIVPPP